MMGTKTDITVDRETQKEIQRGLSRNGQDRIFALKLDNSFCPMTKNKPPLNGTLLSGGFFSGFKSSD